MNNRFKFRIYCKSENKMMLFNNPTLIDGDIMQGGLLFKNYDHKIKNVHKVDPEDLILMQCTGLKDKNGFLIFEGDILQDGVGNIFEVSFIKYCYYVHEIKRHHWMKLDEGHTSYEVIGNVYENPELLVGDNNAC